MEASEFKLIDETCRFVLPGVRLTSRLIYHRSQRKAYGDIELDGITRTLKEWADKIGVAECTLRLRLNTWNNVRRALTEPPNENVGRKRHE